MRKSNKTAKISPKTLLQMSTPAKCKQFPTAKFSHYPDKINIKKIRIYFSSLYHLSLLPKKNEAQENKYIKFQLIVMLSNVLQLTTILPALLAVSQLYRWKNWIIGILVCCCVDLKLDKWEKWFLKDALEGFRTLWVGGNF